MPLKLLFNIWNKYIFDILIQCRKNNFCYIFKFLAQSIITFLLQFWLKTIASSQIALGLELCKCFSVSPIGLCQEVAKGIILFPDKSLYSKKVWTTLGAIRLQIGKPKIIVFIFSKSGKSLVIISGLLLLFLCSI